MKHRGDLLDTGAPPEGWLDDDAIISTLIAEDLLSTPGRFDLIDGRTVKVTPTVRGAIINIGGVETRVRLRDIGAPEGD